MHKQYVVSFFKATYYLIYVILYSQIYSYFLFTSVQAEATSIMAFERKTSSGRIPKERSKNKIRKDERRRRKGKIV